MESLKKFKLNDEGLKQIIGGDCDKTQSTTTVSTSNPQLPSCTDVKTVTSNDCGGIISACYELICPDESSLQ